MEDGRLRRRDELCLLTHCVLALMHSPAHAQASARCHQLRTLFRSIELLSHFMCARASYSCCYHDGLSTICMYTGSCIMLLPTAAGFCNRLPLQRTHPGHLHACLPACLFGSHTLTPCTPPHQTVLGALNIMNTTAQLVHIYMRRQPHTASGSTQATAKILCYQMLSAHHACLPPLSHSLLLVHHSSDSTTISPTCAAKQPQPP